MLRNYSNQFKWFKIYYLVNYRNTHIIRVFFCSLSTLYLFINGREKEGVIVWGFLETAKANQLYHKSTDKNGFKPIKIGRAHV